MAAGRGCLRVMCSQISTQAPQLRQWLRAGIPEKASPSIRRAPLHRSTRARPARGTASNTARVKKVLLDKDGPRRYLARPMSEKIILDTDIGSDIDDAVCLAYLLAIGPLTNVALLFAADVEIPHLLKSLVLMCGVFAQRRSPLVEWNAGCDPHATAIVYRTPVARHRSIGLVALRVDPERFFSHYFSVFG